MYMMEVDGMKKFMAPVMTVQRLEIEEIVTQSGCWEAYDCEECYNDAVICGPGYNCSGLVCGCLGSLHI